MDREETGRVPHSPMRIETIKASIERDEYDVDPRAIADAIVRMLQQRQKECS
jgi:anti-sigma28 factor (negative regulator of flagellin synthesis)